MGLRLAVVVIEGYGVVTLLGGFIGYVKARSVASLVTGSVCGLSLWLCGFGTAQGNVSAELVAALIATMLGARFLMTWRRHHRVMPDLLMVILAASTLIAIGTHLLL